MAPGPKRKGKKDLSNQRGTARQANVASSEVLNEGQGSVNKQQNEGDFQSDKSSEAEHRTNGCYMKNDSKKYSKRQIQSNWDRYEERTPGLFDDTLRGESFDVLACYKGGSDSYLKLKEEKEWCNAKDLEGGLFLDCDALAQLLKCIPLHKRLHVTEDCFTPGMIQKFTDAAKRSSAWKLNSPSVLSCEMGKLPILSAASVSESAIPEVTYKPKVISEKTENIILSLTSSALKDEIPQKLQKVEEALTPTLLTSNHADHNVLPKPETSQDDLTFLLSLSGSDKTSTEAVAEKDSSASIEDWLNELLEK